MGVHFAAFTSVLFAIAFFRGEAAIFVGAAFALAASALFCAQRRRCASRIAFRPARDNLRFGLTDSARAGVKCSASPLIRAHRARWANAIFRRDAALNPFRFGAMVSDKLVFLFPLASIARSSAICPSI
jgi:hypothetical protein